MRAVNRIVMLLLAAALALAGVVAMAFALGIEGFQIGTISENVAPITAAVQQFFTQAQTGTLPVGAQLVLLALAITGAALLFFEIRPYRSHLIPIAEGVYLTEPALEHELELAAAETEGTLDVHADVRASKRRSKVQVDAYIREGLDESQAREQVENRTRQALDRLGIQRAAMRVEMASIDPREAGVRVR